MSQAWRRLTFLHWPYDPAVVRRLLPSSLTLDTFAGAAWVGLVPFEIHNLRNIPHFPETNVRTYVIGPDGSRAVWFFSLDADRLLAVIGARLMYRLPYYWARMEVTPENSAIHYRSRRRPPHWTLATTDIVVEPGDRYQVSQLTDHDHFLTARYRLYTILGLRLAYAQIEHQPWPLARGTVSNCQQTLIGSAGLPPPEGQPLVHYSSEISVKIGHLTMC